MDGLIAVNNRAGGHAGDRSVKALYEELAVFNVPQICAGGVGDASSFIQALDLGYAGVQMGTRFIATQECRASAAYKAAIVSAQVGALFFKTGAFFFEALSEAVSFKTLRRISRKGLFWSFRFDNGAVIISTLTILRRTPTLFKPVDLMFNLALKMS